jgi:hypothetical protein
MSESNNTNEGAGQFTVLDVISRRIEDPDKIKRIENMSNAEAAESFKAVSFLSYHFLPNKRRVFMSKRLSQDSSAFNLSVNNRREGFNI